MLSEPSAFTQKNECTSVLLFLCFAFVFTLLFHSSHSHLSHLNRYHGVVANIGGMGERKTSFSSMPPATKKVWEPCPRAKLNVNFCAHVCFALSFDLCFLFCLLQPKKKGPANPRSKATFNSDLSNWDVTSVADMAGMFRQANAFNCDLSIWDVSSVTNMNDMCLNAKTSAPSHVVRRHPDLQNARAI